VYLDDSPAVNFPPTPRNKVVVIEGGESARDVIRLAKNNGLTTVDADGDQIFWIVFACEPRVVRDFTGKSVRRTIWNERKK
jgi:hypothetical protein